MGKFLRSLALISILSCLGVLVLNAGSAPNTANQHTLVVPGELKWEPIYPGVTMAVISGDPKGQGPYVLRLKTAAGSRIPPHWHPTAENVTVLEGTFALGMGEKFEPAALQDMPVGGFVRIPAEMRHFALSRSDTVVQVHGMGPFVINFVNPADAPKQ